MSDSFCEKLQHITTKKQLCPTPPTVWKFPPCFREENIMNAIFKIPKTHLPKGLNEQFIFVGIGHGLTPEMMKTNNIAGVLNVAYDVYDPEDLMVKDNSKSPITLAPNEAYFLTQLQKVGLIDSDENDIMTLISAVYALDALLNFPSAEELKKNNMVNFFAQGNVFVHCYSGGSRSVTVTALYIYYKFFVGKSTFQDVYTQVIYQRIEEASNHHPTLGICNTAYDIINTFSELFPKPIYR